jgi:GDP-D-glucose phosphorylase
MRRKPQTIDSITPAFDEYAFNFTKVNENEYLFNVILKDMTVSFLINQSPLTPYHSLICPNLMEKHPQILTLDSIKIAMQLMLGFDDRKYRIGFNSPGALASVNHLHMHLIVIEEQLCIEKAVSIKKNNKYIISQFRNQIFGNKKILIIF